MTKAMKKGDKKMIKILSDVIKVPTEIKQYTMIHFLKKSNELGAIAFFQWRHLYPNEGYTEMDLVTEVLEERIENLYKNYLDPNDNKSIKGFKNL